MRDRRQHGYIERRRVDLPGYEGPRDRRQAAASTCVLERPASDPRSRDGGGRDLEIFENFVLLQVVLHDIDPDLLHQLARRVPPA